ncbi:MAG: hypothetical protein HC798_04225 [Polaribacter sp.]|nr:hypothetical protein [Polaribacter sp.]
MFSTVDDQNNRGLAAKINIKQRLIDKKWKLFTNLSHEFAHRNFRTLQRWESIEFNRDWNILTNIGTKTIYKPILIYKNLIINILNIVLMF